MATKSTGSRAAFTERLKLEHPAETDVAERISSWARAHGVILRWSSSPTSDSMVGYVKIGVQEQKLLTCQTNGLVSILFRQLSSRLPAGEPEAKQAFLGELAHKLSVLPKGGFDPAKSGDKASWQLSELAKGDNVKELLRVLDWMVEGLRTDFEDLLSRSRAKKGGRGHRTNRKPGHQEAGV